MLFPDKKKIAAIFVVSFTVLFALRLQASESLSNSFPLNDGSNIINHTFDSNLKLKLVIRIERYNGNKTDFVSESWWGAEDYPPRTIIKKLSISINSVPVPLMITSYSGLSEARKLNVEIIDKDLILNLVGSDAASSYRCEWFLSYSAPLKQYLLRKRIVQLNEFPEVNETTNYDYNERRDL